METYNIEKKYADDEEFEDLLEEKRGKNDKRKKMHDKPNEISKMLDYKINTEDLISEIEKQPAIWDSRTDDYSNKEAKLIAWNSVILAFLPDFEQKPNMEKNLIGKCLYSLFICNK